MTTSKSKTLYYIVVTYCFCTFVAATGTAWFSSLLSKTRVRPNNRIRQQFRQETENDDGNDAFFFQQQQQNEFDFIYQQLCTIQTKQEEYIIDFSDEQQLQQQQQQGKNRFGLPVPQSSTRLPQQPTFNIVNEVNPIINRLLLLSNSKPSVASNEEDDDYVSMTMSNNIKIIYQQLVHIYEQQFDMLRNYYGSMYEVSIEKSLSSLPYDRYKKYIQSIQDRMVKKYRNDMQQITRPLQALYRRHHDRSSVITDSTEFVLLTQLFNTTSYVSKLLFDLQHITELHLNLYDNEDAVQYMNNKMLLRRQRLIQFSTNILKRCIMFGINYIQGYLAIQGIKRIALQQEREMPKFPLF